MRGDGAAEALLREDGVAFGGCEFLGCGEAGGGGTVSLVWGGRGGGGYRICVVDMGEARPRRATLAVKKVLGAPAAGRGGVLAGLRIRGLPLSFFSLEVVHGRVRTSAERRRSYALGNHCRG